MLHTVLYAGDMMSSSIKTSIYDAEHYTISAVIDKSIYA